MPKLLINVNKSPKPIQYFCSNLVSGFTLVETLVALGVLGIFFASVAIILQLVLQNVAESRIRSVALSLAQEKMENVRNLPYNQVGTQGGIPQGALLQSEIKNINSLDFTVKTSIIYIDDPFDGVAPNDLLNTDYKRVRIEIDWQGAYPSRYPVALVANVAPKGIETLAGGGTLYIQVFNSSGIPVSNATVAVDNTSINPNIHIQTLTNANGILSLPGTPPCIACYQVTITKPNYTTDKTYLSSEVANPLQPSATVLEGKITQISFAIDQASQITVNSLGSRESEFPPISNVQFTLKGSKIIGYDTFDEPVYKYSFSTNTGGGTVSIPDLEWDSYKLDFSNSAYNLAGSNPLNPVVLLPATKLTVAISAVPKSNTSLLVAVKKTGGELIASASARLTKLPEFDSTKPVGASGAADFGQAFFGELIPGTYDLNIFSDGYQTATASYSLTTIHQETITLNPNP